MTTEDITTRRHRTRETIAEKIGRASMKPSQNGRTLVDVLADDAAKAEPTPPTTPAAEPTPPAATTAPAATASTPRTPQPDASQGYRGEPGERSITQRIADEYRRTSA
jgi:hypothetical protein